MSDESSLTYCFANAIIYYAIFSLNPPLSQSLQLFACQTTVLRFQKSELPLHLIVYILSILCTKPIFSNSYRTRACYLVYFTIQPITCQPIVLLIKKCYKAHLLTDWITGYCASTPTLKLIHPLLVNLLPFHLQDRRRPLKPKFLKVHTT